jgi:hypothetical protein
MKLELYDDVSQKLVEYVRQIHPPEDSAPPSEKEVTTTPNDKKFEPHLFLYLLTRLLKRYTEKHRS